MDLLALDKQRDLVIIENKLDYSGRDVTWQALKYTSYSSSLSEVNKRKLFQEYLDKAENGSSAEYKLSEFSDNSDYENISLIVHFEIRSTGKETKDILCDITIYTSKMISRKSVI